MSDVLTKLHKIRELAERGVGGEKENAERILKSLLEKHHLEYDEVFKPEPARRWVEFWFRDNFHREIIYGCYCAITGVREFHLKKQGTHHVWLEVTAWEELEMRQMVDYYKRLWTKQLHDVMIAFLVKHKLHSRTPHDDETDNEPMDRVRVHRITSILGGMEDGKYVSTRQMLPGERKPWDYNPETDVDDAGN